MESGLRIKIARMKVNKKQYEVAKEVGISAQYLRQLEAGRSANPSKEVMGKLALALNTTAGELFFDEK